MASATTIGAAATANVIRLRLSPSAMSRALARLRETMGDPLLVRAGRGLVPSPRALELRERVRQLVQDGEAVLRPAEEIKLQQLVRTFTLRTSEGFVENFGPGLIARVGQEAPGVRLRFVPKPDKDSTPLRDASVDLETGVVGKAMGPELRAQALFRDRFIGVVRIGHPLCQGEITPARYAAARQPECLVFPFRSARPRSRFHCSDTRGCRPIRRIAGCAPVFGTLALSHCLTLRQALPVKRVVRRSDGMDRRIC